MAAPRHHRRRRGPTPAQLLGALVAAILVPGLAGGLWSVSGHRSFAHGFFAIAAFDIVLLAIVFGAAVLLSQDRRPPPRPDASPPPSRRRTVDG